MKRQRISVVLALALASHYTYGASADEEVENEIAAAAVVGPVEQVVVQARVRTEKLLDVPIPVSYIGGKQLERADAVTLQDFSRLAPNLLVQAPNARQTSVAIRGVGKNTANDALEPSVGVIVDGVPSAFITNSWGDFSDLDHVEVLRGPQGTLLGKNTTLGVVNVVTKKPSFKPEASAELSVGQQDKLGIKAVIGGPVQDGVLAYRLSLFSERREGPFQDIAPDHTNETFGDRNREGARLQLLLLPSADWSVRFSAERQHSSEWVPYGDPPLLGEPATFANGASRTANGALTFSSRVARPYFGGYQPLLGDWDHVANTGSLPTVSSTNAASTEVNWTPGDGVTVTSITAYRNALFDAHNAEWIPYDIRQYGAIIKQKQWSQELRVSASLNQAIDYTAGLYWLDSQVDALDRTLYGADAGAFYATTANYNALKNTAVGNRLLQDSLRGLFVNTPAHPNTRSFAEFGQLNWHINERGTLTLGLRRTDEDKTNSYTKFLNTDSVLLSNLAAGLYNGATAAEIAAAKSIRASQAANLGSVDGIAIKKPSYAWLVNPSYKLTEDALLFASVGHGEKSGSVQFNSTALTPQNVAPEKTLDAELGAKAAIPEWGLAFSVNAYQTRITDYQQNLTVLDPTLTAQNGVTTYRTYLGNVKGVTLRGLEADASWAATTELRILLSAALNHAWYSDFANAPCPADIAGAPGGAQQCNFTGRQLPFAPRLSGNLGFDYKTPVSAGLDLLAFGNLTQRGPANYNAGLAAFGQQGGYHLIDAGFGIAAHNGKWKLSVVGKNLGDTHYVTNVGAYSTSAALTATPGDRRYIGLVLQSRI